jgi:hypothetical protein
MRLARVNFSQVSKTCEIFRPSVFRRGALKNGNGVIMRLVAKRQGLLLSLGGDAVVIQMNR